MALPLYEVNKKIAEARVLSVLLDISYKKKNGEIVRRTVEPYDVKTEHVLDEYGYIKPVTFLYGYDVSKTVIKEHRHIKRWIINRFLSMRIMHNRSFKPRVF